ncbi:MAG: type II toxin-antitoxin system RelE/ParE family toxin [Chitinophagaceae bacterium]|nr:MAG: type II toxin-antitoxin system RelE/ParE family toxin [Chitinophagaceae bacterium]
MGYKISKKAAEDIEDIWLYTLENWSLEQADRYLDLLLNEIEYLAVNPTAGKDFSHVRKRYRTASVKSHIIFYRHIEGQIEIEVIRVLHQRMDIENRFDE